MGRNLNYSFVKCAGLNLGDVNLKWIGFMNTGGIYPAFVRNECRFESQRKSHKSKYEKEIERIKKEGDINHDRRLKLKNARNAGENCH